MIPMLRSMLHWRSMPLPISRALSCCAQSQRVSGGTLVPLGDADVVAALRVLPHLHGLGRAAESLRDVRAAFPTVRR